ncbi:MAG: helix-turn-helix transcriptional regulator [Pararhodobacter sp.]|nr:helix-turn-helix transcriptional regulator [Pararhodobacter sp.]
MSVDKSDSDNPQDEGLSSSFDEVYDVALDPARYRSFVETWERALAPLRSRLDFGAPRLLDDTVTQRHFDRAMTILDRVNTSAATNDAAAALQPFGSVPALLVDGQLRLRAVNSDATKVLGVAVGGAIADLPLAADDIRQVGRTVRELLSGKKGDTAMLRLHADDARSGAMLFRLQCCTSNTGESLVVVATNRIAWRDGFNEVLEDAFDLTPTEIEIVRGLTEQGSIAEIARHRGRSVDTIRAQLKSILFKTETHSQTELMRLIWSALDMIRSPAVSETDDGAPLSRGQKTLATLEYNRLMQADGRQISYLKLGDPAGRPVVYLSLDLGLSRWPASAEREAARRGICVIVPVRPGYGVTSPVPRTVDYDAALIDDALRILDAEKVARCPILTLGDDAFYGFRLAGAQPARFSALIACAGVLPITRHEQFARMEKWHRNVVATAKYTPHLMMFFAKLGNWFVRKIGKEKFVETVFASSPADLATFADPEVREAMIVGSEIMLTDTFAAHEAYTRSLIGGKTEDWSADAIRLKDQIPVIFMNGLQDQQVHPDTLTEFQQDFDWIDYRIIEEAGQLVLFKEWRMVLDLIEDHMP